jgi:hypothetical protein
MFVLLRRLDAEVTSAVSTSLMGGLLVKDHGVALPRRGDVTTGDEMVGSEGGCDELLNPLTISHTPMNSSQRPPGMAWMELRLKPRTCNTDPDSRIAYPMRPQTARSRGTNCAR